MGPEDALSSKGEEAEMSRLSVSGTLSVPDKEQLELAEAILARLNPADSHELRQMSTRFGLVSGMLLMIVALFWFLAIHVAGNEWGGNSGPSSILFDLNFSQISWLVPVLVFLATLLVSLSRERGGAITATLGGVFLILVIYLAIEPIGHAMLATEGSDLMISLMQTVRLGILGVLVHYSARHFLDAMLVTWVRSVLAGFDVVLAPQDED
ncbi:MAG: hypothetical protein DBX05_04325 [Candidatus Poseidoniales archaeon]|nr:hypothetical protein [Euryarchaeota archaeon]OUX23237.1 MAG: hypothetical protein CBE15_06570 [Euryarchaeota archaeon TMED255]RAH11583.1 MAG: hypothetical protein CMA23_001710 [Euryarchaeota archaeon]RCH73743.1 MAG: hypothetical protein DBX05_04325 [Candidatus Poseidoniales archaeon]CAI8214776.1 MAG: Uncharacterised protein [Euryarchaeota archaeon]|tara:strand:- start:4356 stop:4985 length:630 start_codon:yes stop_codon:yes gene_type:complete